MRTIERSSAFRRDYKRAKANSRHRKNVEALLRKVIGLLSRDCTLPESNLDHPLSGKWKDSRECHVKPDLLLIYEKPDDETLRLARLGSHSELFE